MSSNSTMVESTNVIDITNGLQKHIIYCCRAPEFELRKWLKKALARAGFHFIEDNYQTDRIKQDPRYRNVHNLVAIRGENPDVCLVAHTDVCREHDGKKSGQSSNDGHEDFVKWAKKQSSKDDFAKVKDSVIKKYDPYRLDPVLKTIIRDNEERTVIQDRMCKFQVGGDDRLGVAINSWIALNTGYDMGLYFPTDEEVGLKSARACQIEELKGFDVLVQVDRGNKSNELVTKINQEILCTYEVGARLLRIAYEMGKPRSPVVGAHTDVYALKSKGWIKNCVNMTCGYHESHGSSPSEYIDVEEAEDTLRYCSEIIKHWSIYGRSEQ